MEYTAMLKVPGLVTGMLELVADSEPTDVKRTIRVFTNVYRHSLALLATGEFEAVVYENSYPDVTLVSRRLIELLRNSVDEGVTVQLVRYLESAAETHMQADLSKYPQIAQLTNPALQKVFDALVEYVGTPYVSGSPFCLAIRAIFSIACYREELRPAVVTLATKLLDTPPPNFFEHNVRGYKKVLQRNFFRFLKLAKSEEDKEKLLGLLTRVGISRRRLSIWLPKVSKKRPVPKEFDSKMHHRNSLHEKKKVKLSSQSHQRESVPVTSTATGSAFVSSLKSSELPKSDPSVNSTEMRNKILAGVTSVNSERTSDIKESDLAPPPLVRRSSAEEVRSSAIDCHSPVVARRSSAEERTQLARVESSADQSKTGILNQATEGLNSTLDALHSSKTANSPEPAVNSSLDTVSGSTGEQILCDKLNPAAVTNMMVMKDPSALTSSAPGNEGELPSRIHGTSTFSSSIESSAPLQVSRDLRLLPTTESRDPRCRRPLIIEESNRDPQSRADTPANVNKDVNNRDPRNRVSAPEDLNKEFNNRDPRNKAQPLTDVNNRDPRSRTESLVSRNNPVHHNFNVPPPNMNIRDPRVKTSLPINGQTIFCNSPVLEEILLNVKHMSNTQTSSPPPKAPHLSLPSGIPAPAMTQPPPSAHRDPRKLAASGIASPVSRDPRQKEEVSVWDNFQ